MAYLSDFTNREGFNASVVIPGVASFISQDISASVYTSHIDLSETTIVATYYNILTPTSYIKVGTRISETCIEWGTAVTFAVGVAYYPLLCRVNDTKFIVVYGDTATSVNGQARAGTVSGTTITFGSACVFFNAPSTYLIGAVLLDTDKILIAFAYGTTEAYSMCLTVSGVTVTACATQVFATGNITSGGMTGTQLCKHSTTLASVVYYVSSTVTEVVTLSVSGTTITVNTAGKAAFGGSATIYNPSISALDSTSFVLAYTDTADTNKCNVQVGTISSTTITARTEYVADASNYSSRQPKLVAVSTNTFVVMYINSGGLYCVKMGKVQSDWSVTFGTERAMADASINYGAIGSTSISLTFTKTGLVTFSIVTSTFQYVAGVVTYATDNLLSEFCPMTYRVATAVTGEQIEISSLYLKSNNIYGFYSPTIRGSLFFGGSLPINRFYSTMDTSDGTSSYVKTKRLNMANNPIILTAGQSLYASVESAQDTNFINGGCTIYGLKRTT